MKLAIASVMAGVTLMLVCQDTTQAADPRPATVYELMKNVVAVQTQVVWDVGNNAMDDQGNPSAAKLKQADWDKVANAGAKVKQAAQALAQPGAIVVAAPGQKIDGEGNPGAWGAKQVQKAVDANPAAFRAFANQMQVLADQFVTAAKARDAVKFAAASNQMDQVCEQCHQQFWYPEQKQ